MGGAGGLSASASSSASSGLSGDTSLSYGANNSGAINFAPNSSAQTNKTITIAVIALVGLGAFWVYSKNK